MFPSAGRRLLLSRQAAAATSRSHPHASLFSSSPPIPTPKSHSSYSSTPLINPTNASATVSYLVASCGLSPDAALLSSRNLRIKSTAKADAVLALLHNYGFSDADISKMARNAPQLLAIDPDKILKPKLDFFVSLGFSGPSLPKFLSHAPLLLARSLEKHLVPCVDFLRGILRTDANIVAAVTRIPRALQADLDKVMRPAVQALRRHGLPEETISRLVVIQMGVLMIAPDRIGEIIEDLQAVGLQLTDTQFLYGFRVFCSLKRSTWERKIALYRSFGLSESKILKAFRSQPTILMFSDEMIEKKLRFFLDKLKLNLADIIVRPMVLAVSLEKTILPRCAVLSVLMREGKIGQDINLFSPLLSSAKVFSQRYVSKYQHDVPDVLKAYEGKIEFQGFRDRLEGFPLKSRHCSSGVRSH